MTQKYLRSFVAAAALAAGASTMLHGQQAPQRFQPQQSLMNAPSYAVPDLPKPPAITPNGEVVEDVIVRVNDRIITRSEYERSVQQLAIEAQQQNLPPAEYAQRQKDLLRDMIDQQLLLSKGKELGISGDAETVRRLDEIRKQYHLDSMEALEKAAAQQGVSFEDFKANIRNGVITQEVVRDEVGRRVVPTRAQEDAYYAAHKAEFQQPESIHLSEILVPTPENATDAQVTQAQAKADDIASKLKAGAKFADLAKQYSGDTSANRGGELGDFKRGQLGQVLEDATFSLPAGGLTPPIRTRQGYVILRVDSHTAAGVAPLASVEGQVQEAIYLDALQPALRAYLTKARQDAYLDIKPGFVDTGLGRRDPKQDLAYTTYTAPKVKKKTEQKRRMEAQKDALAQQRLAEARERAAQKAAIKAAKASGAKGDAVPKLKKIKREKIRFGQAPRNSLPPGPSTGQTQTASGSLGGEAPGVAMAAPQAGTTVTAGTGTAPENDAQTGDPLAPQEGPKKKTRYTARQADIELAKATDKAKKATEHQQAKPIAASKQEASDETHQAAPLGLRGDTVKAPEKKKRQKGDKKERLQEKPKPVDPTVPIDPTVNKNIGVSPTKPSSDQTTIPPVNAPAPGGNPNGQPLDPTKPEEPANTPNNPPKM